MADPGLNLGIEAALLGGPDALAYLRLHIFHDPDPRFPKS
jgi:hypothetical protein